MTAALEPTTETTETTAPPPAPERIAASDLPYHRRVLANRRDAEAAAAMASAAMASWWHFLKETYELHEDDIVDEAGTITRAAKD